MYRILSAAGLCCLLACNTPHPSDRVDASVTEAREDSLALAVAYAGQALVGQAVTASRETDVAKAAALDDAADDPAIWIHPADPARSLVYGSNKQGGLAVYDLAGTEVAYYPIGKVNNVDILTGVTLGGETFDLLGCSNRTEQSFNLFRIDPETGALTDVAARTLTVDSSRIDDVYGFCLGRAGADVYAVINGKNGFLQQFLLVPAADGFDVELVREHAFPSQTEGMVTDDAGGWLYVGEEAAGIWKLPLRTTAGERGGEPVATQLLAHRVGTPESLVADVEGLALYDGPGGTGYLVASMQGNFSYALFERGGDNAYVSSFKIVDGAVDGVEETDGLEIVSTPLPGFPRGLLVVQDGFNYDGDTLRPQNFKYVDFGKVLDGMLLSR
ncbi:phytase [Lewinella sp. IMCC34183]|uniref:phytase n=1 Tax=Lewinella sp. IMCC34183 TaxID=2248762 RepID=UPI000E258437|nr:phytase [Lewinella sp. IMCC34183]